MAIHTIGEMYREKQLGIGKYLLIPVDRRREMELTSALSGCSDIQNIKNIDKVKNKSIDYCLGISTGIVQNGFLKVIGQSLRINVSLKGKIGAMQGEICLDLVASKQLGFKDLGISVRNATGKEGIYPEVPEEDVVPAWLNEKVVTSLEAQDDEIVEFVDFQSGEKTTGFTNFQLAVKTERGIIGSKFLYTQFAIDGEILNVYENKETYGIIPVYEIPIYEPSILIWADTWHNGDTIKGAYYMRSRYLPEIVI